MKRLSALLLAIGCGTAGAAAQVVDIAWTAEGRFAHATTLAPKELLEICGKLPKGSRVAWSFEANAPAEFNIHVHQGKDVIYPTRLDRVERAEGVQTFDAEPAHCWMWTNKSGKAMQIRAELRQER